MTAIRAPNGRHRSHNRTRPKSLDWLLAVPSGPTSKPQAIPSTVTLPSVASLLNDWYERYFPDQTHLLVLTSARNNSLDWPVTKLPGSRVVFTIGMSNGINRHRAGPLLMGSPDALSHIPGGFDAVLSTIEPGEILHGLSEIVLPGGLMMGLSRWPWLELRHEWERHGWKPLNRRESDDGRTVFVVQRNIDGPLNRNGPTRDQRIVVPLPSS